MTPVSVFFLSNGIIILLVSQVNRETGYPCTASPSASSYQPLICSFLFILFLNLCASLAQLCISSDAPSPVSLPPAHSSPLVPHSTLPCQPDSGLPASHPFHSPLVLLPAFLSCLILPFLFPCSLFPLPLNLLPHILSYGLLWYSQYYLPVENSLSRKSKSI